jgi:hypothetical protein
MKRRTKRVLWVLGSLLVCLGLAVLLWIRNFHSYTPAEVILDIKAGIAAKDDGHPVEKFMDLRYGSQSEPANREKAFLDFFNVGHVQGLELMVNHMPQSMREPRINEMAQWVADYRKTMTPEEKQALREHLNTPAGRLAIQQATQQYLSQDVYYRGATANVIRELMATLTEIQKP